MKDQDARELDGCVFRTGAYAEKTQVARLKTP
jgi:hypothetical protein